jgi:hypothetical protein
MLHPADRSSQGSQTPGAKRQHRRRDGEGEEAAVADLQTRRHRQGRPSGVEAESDIRRRNCSALAAREAGPMAAQAGRR